MHQSNQNFWHSCTFYGNMAALAVGALFPYISHETRTVIVSFAAMQLFAIIKSHGGFGDIGGKNVQQSDVEKIGS